MAKWMRPWMKDVVVFVGIALLNLVLILPCGLIVAISDSPKKGFGVSDLWYWVFATPAMLVNALGWKEAALVLLCINPIIYGLM